MNPEEKILQINKEIQFATVDNYNSSDKSLTNKIEELKDLMVSTYESDESINKYVVRLPMWLLDASIPNCKKFTEAKDKDIKTNLLNNLKKITNEAIELFEHSRHEHHRSRTIAV